MPAAEPGQDDLTTAEAAAALQVEVNTIRRWLRQGRLHGTRLGRTRNGWRIPVSEIERMLGGQQSASADAGAGERWADDGGR